MYELLLAWARPGMWVRSESPLTLADSQPEPDVSVVEGRRADFLKQHPSTAALVVEIAVSTISDDRDLADMYAEAGVLEYWIVNAKDRCLEVHRQPVDGHYSSLTFHSEGTVVECQSLPGFHCSVSALFSEVPLEG
jgi:Uma2 family endonuclease